MNIKIQNNTITKHLKRNKMTAVEFLFNAVYRDMPYPELLGLIAQARIMEKQQIINAYKEGVNGTKLVEQYYNETFNK